MNMDGTARKVIEGDVRTVARLIRDIDDGSSGVRHILKSLFSHTGKAYVIGITGSPGVGKSTLVNRLVSELRKTGKTVGVLAVDPTSPFSGGAILGDRVRMQQHCTDPGVFIRSLATRGQFGGLTQSTSYAVDVLDAMGKDYIVVETVGVGQDEVDIVKTAHTTVILLSPGMGDDIQAIKAGILEVGNIFVVNKADQDGADKAVSNLRSMINLGNSKYATQGWTPPILKTEALSGKGMNELIDEINSHRNYLSKEGSVADSMMSKERIRDRLSEMIKSRLMESAVREIIDHVDFEASVDAVEQGQTDLYSACDDLLVSKGIHLQTK